MASAASRSPEARVTTGDGAALGLDPRHMRVVSKGRAPGRGEVGDGAGQRVHAAPRIPDAGVLDMRDEHQGGGRQIGRRAAIGRVAPEQLAQPRVGKMLAERRPQDVERADALETAEPGQPVRGDELVEPRPLRADERPVERLEHLLRPLGESAVAVGLAPAREGRDRRHRALEIGEEVEPLVRAPGVTGEDFSRGQRHMRVEARAGVGEQLVEDPAHGEDRRSGVDRRAVHRQMAHLAARRRSALENGDVSTLAREVERRGEPADAGADDDDPHAAIIPTFAICQ